MCFSAAGESRGKNHMPENRITMKELPVQEQPYEKCFQQGPHAMTDAELLAVILKTGSDRESALSLSNRILDLSPEGGLLGLCHLSLEELMKLRGVGRVKAIQLKCVCELSARIASSSKRERIRFTDPEEVAGHYMEICRHLEQETVILLMLDTKGRLIREQEISRGTVNAALISGREIFREALRCGAVSIILIHNHPSGDPTPSREDIQLTEHVARSGELLGITLLDHIIIGDLQAVSFRQEQLL